MANFDYLIEKASKTIEQQREDLAEALTEGKLTYEQARDTLTELVTTDSEKAFHQSANMVSFANEQGEVVTFAATNAAEMLKAVMSGYNKPVEQEKDWYALLCGEGVQAALVRGKLGSKRSDTNRGRTPGAETQGTADEYHQAVRNIVERDGLHIVIAEGNNGRTFEKIVDAEGNDGRLPSKFKQEYERTADNPLGKVITWRGEAGTTVMHRLGY